MFWQGKIKIQKRKKIIVLIARGEAVRNFVYTDFLKLLSKSFSITIITTINHSETNNKLNQYADEVLELKSFKEKSWVVLFREIIHTAHYRLIWTEAVKYYWGRHDKRVKGDSKAYIRLKIWRFFSYFFFNKVMLQIGTSIDRWLSIKFNPTKEFDILFKKIKPDIVFNCSHIHGVAADLPVRVAKKMGITTTVFLFSWDNLYSRGRIFPKYNYYFVWNNSIKNHLLDLYKGEILESMIKVTGTPQFDFHHDNKFNITRKEFFDEFNLDIKRPYILYTTGMASDFQVEYKIVEGLIDYIKRSKKKNKPQLVVRTYIKGTTSDMYKLAIKYENDRDVLFPEILWYEKWLMPKYEDCFKYSNLLRYSCVGINAASTVSLELMMFNKPIINIGFEPPGSKLDYWCRFSRHINYEHYKAIVDSGAVMVAVSMRDLIKKIELNLKDPSIMSQNQFQFLNSMFDGNYKINSSKKVVGAINNIVDNQI